MAADDTKTEATGSSMSPPRRGLPALVGRRDLGPLSGPLWILSHASHAFLLGTAWTRV